MNNHKRKFHRALSEMEEAGVTQSIRIDTDLWRLRRFGLKPNPFLYWESPLASVAVFVLLVSLISLVQAGAMVLFGKYLWLPDILGPAVIAAAPLTFLTIALRLYQRKAYKLSRWEDL
ncbi:DUF6404 family protein [uncultured Ruegeria sp.]|uniref:DUF6404 family protein n=1 Tax=uncultured Ruegeria sp. TaxID=259304 RepID=UPI00345C356B